MHFLAGFFDLRGVLGQAELLPAAGDGPQHSNQRGRGSDGNAPGHCVVNQPGIGVQRRRQELVAWNEHHHEVKRIVLFGAVIFAGQAVHLTA